MALETQTSLPAFWRALLYSFIFFTVGIGSIGYWASETVALKKQLSQLPELVEFYKGSFYLLGIGLGTVTLAAVAVVSQFTNRYSGMFNVMLIISVAVMVLFPQLTHLYVSNRLEGEGYEACADKSRRWLHNVRIVYAKTPQACAAEEEPVEAPKRRRAQPIASISGL